MTVDTKVINDLLDKATKPSTGEASPLKNIVRGYMEVTVGQLRAAIEANPKHPTAVDYAVSVNNAGSDSEKLVVEKEDMLALLQNKTIRKEMVEKDHPFIKGRKITAEFKVLEDTPSASPTPTPAPAFKERPSKDSGASSPKE